MSQKAFVLEEYLTDSVEAIVREAMKASLHNPRESLFMARFALASRRATKLRRESEGGGRHVPPFLIASITSSCNLSCNGCYSMAIGPGSHGAQAEQLDAESWEAIFREASSLGISFILLAGGEPLMRRDVIEKASTVQDVMFPVFTNGTLLDDGFLRLLDRNRNLVPVLSLEGNRETTDDRRGKGVHRAVTGAMDRMRERGMLFGVSVTVTRRNLEEVMSCGFVDGLYQAGCRLVIYVEYVPVVEITRNLAPGDGERRRMAERLQALRDSHADMVFISFPGDEATSGGCLAAGRGFFHVNHLGGAEPCPFSPFSDINVKDVGLAGAMDSKLFHALQEKGLLEGGHEGGCVLFGKEAGIRELLGSPKE